MDTVKTYRQVNQSDSTLSFGISKMEEIYAKRKGKPDVPHRHDFYTILVVKQATGNHIVDFKTHTLSKNQVYFISPGQVHQLSEEGPSIGFSIVFSEDFLALNNILVDFIEDINLFHEFGNSPPLQIDDQAMEKLDSFAMEMLSYFESNRSYRFEAIGALLKLLLISCHNLCSLNQLDTQTLESGGTLLRSFKQLVNQKFKEWHHTSTYADALNITPDHLNRVVKSLTGKTAKEHLQSRLTTEAKRMLYFSSLSNKEIAYELGFSEPGNFSSFFKTCTGVSPSKFKPTA